MIGDECVDSRVSRGVRTMDVRNSLGLEQLAGGLNQGWQRAVSRFVQEPGAADDGPGAFAES